MVQTVVLHHLRIGYVTKSGQKVVADGLDAAISSGELTPNLKVKRQVVIAHYQQEIDEIYSK